MVCTCIYLLFTEFSEITHVFHDVNEALLEGLRLHLSVKRLSIGEGGEVKNSMVIYRAKVQEKPRHSYHHEWSC